MLDVVIVGSGPAGLSAAIYASRAGLSTKVISGDTKGGLLTTTEQVDNYLGLFGTTGNDMADIFLEHSQKFGAEIVSGTVREINVLPDGYFQILTDKDEAMYSKTVVYTAGSTPRKLEVPGEDLDGISYCATCDGDFYADEPVIVVGGGETAAEDALYLSQMCKTVDVLVRSEWRATDPAVNKLEEQSNVTIHKGVHVQEVLGEDEVSGVLLNNGEELLANGLFIAVGQLPNSEQAKKHTLLDQDGFIEHSSVNGFFIAGDITNPDYRQVAVAVGDGAKAGIDATRYVLNE